MEKNLIKNKKNTKADIEPKAKNFLEEKKKLH